MSNEIRWGRMPKASECRCLDCGGQAKEYDHHLGYGEEHKLDVQPVCVACHNVRKGKRGALEHGHPLLSNEQIRAMRTLAGTLRNFELARVFAVDTATVSRVLSGQTWRHLD